MTVIALIIYCICWNIDPYVFGFAFLAVGSVCMIQAVFSIALIVFDRKDIAYWQRDIQVLIGVMGLVALHAILLIVIKGIHWA